MTGRQVINAAFNKIGVKVAEQALQAQEFQDGKDALNLMMKAWQAQGLHLWSKDEGIIFLDVGKTDYKLGPTGDEATTLDDFISTTTTNAEIAASKIIEVASTTGMLLGDKIGIALDDKTRHWDVILTVDSSTQVTLTAGIASASKAGSTVFTFTNLIQRPLRILSTRRKTFNEDSEISVNSWSRNEYFNQVNKVSQGTVVNSYYSPQLDDGRFYVWQTSDSIEKFLRITFERPIQDIDTGDENLDFPGEWLEAIIYNLAFRLSDDYDAPPQKISSVAQKAVQFLDDLMGFDEEVESLNLMPGFN